MFHNTLRRDRLGRVRFTTHLGTGAAGYPGGQATAIRALALRALAGTSGPGEREVLSGAVRWLLSRVRPDGRLPRAERVFPEREVAGIALGPDTRSDGGDAEAALALLLAARGTGEAPWRDAGLSLLAKVEDAFSRRGHLRGYLRDAREDEPECASHVWAALAHLEAAAASADGGHVRAAARHGIRLASWIRPGPIPSLDTMPSSFGPRVAPCESLWAAGALLDLERATGDAAFRRAADACAGALRAEDGGVGYTEAVYLDAAGGLHPLEFECAYTAEAVLAWARRLAPSFPEPTDVPPLWKEAPRTLGASLLRRRWVPA